MRAWLCAAVLLILPLLVYWPTVTHEYGFRDDYAHLREVRERPGWLMTLTTSNGRPVYGAALEVSLQRVHDVTELTTLRTHRVPCSSASSACCCGGNCAVPVGATRRPRRSVPPSRCCRERKSSSAGPSHGRWRSGWSRRSRGLRSSSGLREDGPGACGTRCGRQPCCTSLAGLDVSDERAVRSRAARGRLLVARRHDRRGAMRGG